MKVIFGLGNAETKYNNTYHNIGFEVVDKLAENFGVKFDANKCDGQIAQVYYKRNKILLVKPTTYMNLSGNCVYSVMNKYLLTPKDILVVLDDIDLQKGKFRFRESGSGGTHNGLKNIVQRLGTTDFERIRIGVGRDANMDLADYVLSKIDADSRVEINKAINDAVLYIMDKLEPKNDK